MAAARATALAANRRLEPPAALAVRDREHVPGGLDRVVGEAGQGRGYGRAVAAALRPAGGDKRHWRRGLFGEQKELRRGRRGRGGVVLVLVEVVVERLDSEAAVAGGPRRPGPLRLLPAAATGECERRQRGKGETPHDHRVEA